MKKRFQYARPEKLRTPLPELGNYWLNTRAGRKKIGWEKPLPHQNKREMTRRRDGKNP